jgi:putative addiction module component (TIGR02574 family)
VSAKTNDHAGAGEAAAERGQATDLRSRRPSASPGERAILTAVTDEASRILDAALQLPDRERVELAVILADSIGDGSSPEEVRASWLAEVERRREALARGEETLVDFDDMMARLRAKVRRSSERRASTG